MPKLSMPLFRKIIWDIWKDSISYLVFDFDTVVTAFNNHIKSRVNEIC